MMCPLKWKLLGSSFTLIILLVFRRFLKMKSKKSCVEFDFCHFWTKGEYFLLGSFRYDCCQKWLILRFLVLAGRVYGN